MRQKEALAWYDDLIAKYATLPMTENDKVAERAARAWVTQAEAALEAVFPPEHACRRSWKHATLADEQMFLHDRIQISGLLGVFEAAKDMLASGRIGNLIDTVRAESCDELLDQADVLLAKGHISAAATIAGGSLESHLRHLVSRHHLVVTGNGSISNYDAAISQARNQGHVIYSAVDTKLVTGWGGIRNQAAHDPGTFNRSSQDIQRMIEGVREFIARTS
jgi:hypothetical protein